MIRLTLISVFSVIISIVLYYTIPHYVGSSYVYVMFTVTSNVLLYFGFRKNAFFFDTFIGIFLWLGFWFKTTIVLVFLNGNFTGQVGAFQGTGAELDNALIIASTAFLALILASLIREKYIFKYPKLDIENSRLFYFYQAHRKKIISFYVVLFLFIAISNSYFHIYQRGGISPENISFIISGMYKWLLLFGLASFAALILKYEFSIKNKPPYFVSILTLIESAITNVSLLSRGMLLNSSSLGLGLMKFSYVNKLKISWKYWLILISIMIIIFILSISFANKLREHSFAKVKQNNTLVETISEVNIVKNTRGIAHLFVGRSVGMEGLLAISTYPNLGWEVFNDALNEKYDENKTGFYDHLFDTYYKNSKEKNSHIVSMPGFIAFFYYPGSLYFIFISIFIIGIIASLIEILAYKLGKNNQILAALIAQVVAYRLTHFGYVPAQSYLLFGTILINLFLIYGFDKFLSFWYKKQI